MFVIRLILLVLAALFVRRLVRRAFAPPSRRVQEPGPVDRPESAARPYREQEISDADFEEIP
ncbi:MAG: hypothetical protein R6X35_08365 [Candidatus Krumholzibacteriia bacterium]